MPIYEFRCGKCDAEFEALLRMGDTGESLSCPECGTSAPTKKLSVFAASSASSEPSCGAGPSCGGGSPFG